MRGVPTCPNCSGVFVCGNDSCVFPLRKIWSKLESEIGCDCGGSLVCISCGALAGAEESAETRAIQGLIKSWKRGAYTESFEVGPRDGAMIDFGNLIRLECFFPFEGFGLSLPFLPMPLDDEVIHDLERSSQEECLEDLCHCPRLSGWFLNLPILRAVLGCTSAFLYDHSAELPGRLPGRALRVDTFTFFSQCYFDDDFVFSIREESRAKRSARSAKARHARRRRMMGTRRLTRFRRSPHMRKI